MRERSTPNPTPKPSEDAVNMMYEMYKDRQRSHGDAVGQWSAAGKSVLRNPKSYLSFIAAILLIQTLLCILISGAVLDLRNTREEILHRYDYDVLLRDLTQPEYAALHNLVVEIPEELLGTEAVPYRSIRYEKTDYGTYNVYVTLRGDDVELELAQLQQNIFSVVATVEGSMMLTLSPLYNYHAYTDSLTAQAVVSVLLLLALSTFLLAMLQRTRLNHEKYQYGIYMTFGAGYRQLFQTALGELLAIVALTALPALVLGNLGSALLCIGTGKTWGPSWQALVLPFLLCVVSAWISVRFPMRATASKPPVQLLQAMDNSNLVTSPRRSLHIFGRSFPLTYEAYSLWRYRRYLAGLLGFTMLFAALWLGLVRVADFNTAKEGTAAPEYTVTFNPEIVNADRLNENMEELAQTIEESDAIAYCNYRISRHVMENRAFLAVSREAARGAGRYVVHSRATTGEAHPYATNAAAYVAYNKEALDRLVARCEQIDGDPYAVLQDDRAVILSTAIHNTQRFDFAPGDTVILATNRMTKISSVMANNNLDILRMMLAEEEFILDEYTVCAVIRDRESGSLLHCGVNHAAYRALTGMDAYTTQLDVYLPEGADFDTLQAADEAVQDAAGNYYTTEVISHNDLFSRYLTSFRNLSARMITAAYFLLAMMPLFSFFSQRVFYGKRSQEWFILKTLGGQRRERKRLLLVSGAILTAINFIAMLPLGFLADYLAFKLCNEWLPAGGFLASALMHYTLSPVVIPVLLFFALLCGFAPCALEYRYVVQAMRREDEIEGILAAERAQYAEQSNSQEE